MLAINDIKANGLRLNSGTGNTIPFSCVNSHDEAVALSSELIFSNSSDVALGRLWSRGTVNANICYEKANNIGGLIGTAFVARDLMSVVDALDEDGKLRYWGTEPSQSQISRLTKAIRLLVWHNLGGNCRGHVSR